MVRGSWNDQKNKVGKAINSLKELKRGLLGENVKEARGGPIETDTQLIANLQFYHDNMVHHESLLQWYRVLSITFEAAIFAIAFFIIRNHSGWWVLIPFIFGIGGCVAWSLVCTQRTNFVDKQRGEIEKLIEGSALSRWVDIYKGEKGRRIAQIMFNVVLPGAIIILWFLLLRN